MLNDIFRVLLVPSIAGIVLTGIITLAKPLTRRVFGYSWHYYIWMAVLIVMLLPIQITLPERETPVADPLPVQTTQPDAAELPDITQPPEELNIPQTALPKAEAVSRKISVRKYDYLGIIWLSGAIILLMIHLIGYARLLIRLNKGSYFISCPEAGEYTRKKVRVRVCEGICSPFMLGIFRPTLVLPERELTCEQLDNILRHEMTHLRRGDVMYKWFAVLVKCIHWFNPVIYYVTRQINAECEISCDLSVVSHMDKEQEGSYITTILSLISSEKTRNLSLTTGMTGSKKALKRRFIMIKNRKKTNRIVSVLSAVLSVALMSGVALAGGVMAGEVFDNGGVFGKSDIEVYIGEKAIQLANQPFIANDTVYLPLREMLNLEGINDITYNNGYVEFIVYTDEPVEYRGIKYDNWRNRVQIGSRYAYIAGHSEGSTENAEILREPIAIDGVTYVPYDLFLKLRDAEGIFEDLSVTVSSGADSLAGTLYINDEINIKVELPLSLCEDYHAEAAENHVYFTWEQPYRSFTIVRQEKSRGMELYKNMTDVSVIIPKNTAGNALYDYLMLVPLEAPSPTNQEIKFLSNNIYNIVIIGPLPEEQTEDGSEIVKPFRFHPIFLQSTIDRIMERLNVNVPYEYSILNYEVNSDEMIYYIEIREDGSDSLDYLTIKFVNSPDGWVMDESYLEK